MSKYQKISLFLMRISLGWLFLYAGITKIINPNWSAEGYIKGAKTFAALYNLLLSPQILPFVNFLNKWGLTLIGISLIIGLFVKLSSIFGASMMFLYYFPILSFPKVGANSLLVDDHIIYVIVFVALASFNAGRYWGLDSRLEALKKVTIK